MGLRRHEEGAETFQSEDWLSTTELAEDDGLHHGVGSAFRFGLGLGLLVLGLAIIVGCAIHLGDGSPTSGLGWAAAFIGLLASQGILIAGALVACSSFELRCKTCGAPVESTQVHFGLSEHEEITRTVRTGGPWGVLSLLDRATTPSAGESHTVLCIDGCSGCKQAGHVSVSVGTWDEAQLRSTITEAGRTFSRRGWVVAQLLSGAGSTAARGP